MQFSFHERIHTIAGSGTQAFESGLVVQVFSKVIHCIICLVNDIQAMNAVQNKWHG